MKIQTGVAGQSRFARRLVAAGAVALAAIVLAGLAATAQASAKPKPVRVALLVGAATNAYQSASIDAARKAAKRLNASLTIFDANFDPTKQISQLEDVIALGKKRFDAVGFFPIDNLSPIPTVKKALKAGLKVGISDAVLGPKLDTSAIQVRGVSVQASPVWSRQGVKIGQVTIQACRGLNPCKVGWVGGLSKIWPPETEFRTTFGQTIAGSTNIQIAAEVGDTQYTREGGLKVIGTLVQSKPDLDVIIAADQAQLGAETALKDAGLLGKVRLIGLGGTFQAKERIGDGRWFGTVAQAPRTEGRVLIEGLVKAVRTGKNIGGIDSAALVVSEGVITRENVARWVPQFTG